MTLKALETMPTAFLVGIGAPLGYRAFQRLALTRTITSTRATELIAYAVIGIVPFLVCVIGVDPKRWNRDENYWFSHEGKTDQRRTWMRRAAYFAGTIIGYAL
jgi:hypothetical protein